MAPLGVIGYVLPATVALAAVPGLVSVTLLTVSPFTRPAVVKADADSAAVWPKTLVALSAVIVSEAVFTVNRPVR